jgi:hypothetical protein
MQALQPTNLLVFLLVRRSLQIPKSLIFGPVGLRFLSSSGHQASIQPGLTGLALVNKSAGAQHGVDPPRGRPLPISHVEATENRRSKFQTPVFEQ